MTFIFWRKPGARFLTIDLWRLRVLFRVSPSWPTKPFNPPYEPFMVDWWWKDDYQMGV